MTSLTEKLINGRTYWYLRETAWVDGKSKVVKTVRLGSAEQVALALGKGTTPLQVVPGAPVFEFGAVLALYDLAKRLGIQEIIDRHVSKRGRGLSVSTLLIIAATNRAVAPTSKAGIAKRYERSSLTRMLKLKPGQLTSQRFWDNMDRIPASPHQVRCDPCARTTVTKVPAQMCYLCTRTGPDQENQNEKPSPSLTP